MMEQVHIEEKRHQTKWRVLSRDIGMLLLIDGFLIVNLFFQLYSDISLGRRIVWFFQVTLLIGYTSYIFIYSKIKQSGNVNEEMTSDVLQGQTKVYGGKQLWGDRVYCYVLYVSMIIDAVFMGWTHTYLWIRR